MTYWQGTGIRLMLLGIGWMIFFPDQKVIGALITLLGYIILLFTKYKEPK